MAKPLSKRKWHTAEAAHIDPDFDTMQRLNTWFEEWRPRSVAELMRLPCPE
jgi:hypothetical protein